MPSNAPRNFVSVQYLRGIAAVAVVYFHTKIYMPGAEWSLDRSFGYGGVDLFFIISGFIMMHTTYSNEGSPWTFLLKRAGRIYPVYWIAATLAFAIYLLMPSFFGGATVDGFLVLFSYLLLPLQNGDDTSFGVPFLSIAWTLILEVYFYAVFAVALVSRRPMERLLMMGVFLSGMVAYGATTQLSSALLLFYTNPLVLEFLFGMIVAWVVRHFRPRAPNAVLVFLLVMVFVPLFLVGGGHGDRFARVICFGIPASGIAMCLVLLERQGGLPRALPALRTIGDASYSIYLFHPFALSGLKLFVKIFHIPTAGTGMGALLVLGGTACATALGVVFYRLCEKPITRHVGALIRRHTDRPAAAAGGPFQPAAPFGEAASSTAVQRLGWRDEKRRAPDTRGPP